MMLMIIESAVKAGILIALAAGVSRLMARSAASTRHAVWLATIAVAVALPLIAPFTPGRYLPFLPDFAPRSTHVVAEDSPIRINRPPSSTQGHQLAASPNGPEADYQSLIAVLWLSGALIVAGRYTLGFIRLRRLMATARVSSDATKEARHLGLPSNGMVFLSESGSAMTWGSLHPIVLLPDDVAGWSPERREAVLRHEIAHVRRHDFASQLLAELACALYWFNPIVWLGARAMRAEAESAADDAVLRSGMKPSTYASELLQLAAEFGRRPPTLVRVGIPIIMQPKIEQRLKSVLSPAARRRGITRPQALAAIVAVAIVVPSFAGLHATTAGSYGPRPRPEIDEAMKRLKMVALATIMYSQDYDDMLPNGSTTAKIVNQLMPYAKNPEMFQSPAPGGVFEFSPALRGVNIGTIQLPASTSLWIEKLKNATLPFGVAYVDGHVALKNTGRDGPVD